MGANLGALRRALVAILEDKGGDGLLAKSVDRQRLRSVAPESPPRNIEVRPFASWYDGQLIAVDKDTGQRLGTLNYRPGSRKNQVYYSEAWRGTGAGKALYKHLLDKTLSEGKVLASDSSLSPFSAHVYDRMAKDGFSVVRAPSKVAKVDFPKGMKGYRSRESMEPVFVVGPKGSSEYELLQQGMIDPINRLEYALMKAGRTVKAEDLKKAALGAGAGVGLHILTSDDEDSQSLRKALLELLDQ